MSALAIIEIVDRLLKLGIEVARAVANDDMRRVEEILPPTPQSDAALSRIEEARDELS